MERKWHLRISKVILIKTKMIFCGFKVGKDGISIENDQINIINIFN